MSAAGQRDYLEANKYLLLSLLAGSVVAAIAPLPERLFPIDIRGNDHWVFWLTRILAVTVAVMLAGGLWLTATLRNTKKAAAWYDGRAFAESTKSMAWKYMMGAEPYGTTLSTEEADDLFCEDLKKLLADASPHSLPGRSAAGDQISDSMVTIRKLDVAGRLATYVRARIEDQRAWYSQRSMDHAKSSKRWFRITLAVNCLALTLGIAAVAWFPAIGVTGVVTTAASCCVAWMQIQRYADLAHAYSFTSHEIGLLAPRARGIRDDHDLARFVADCETAFSREHTMWRARREIADG